MELKTNTFNGGPKIKPLNQQFQELCDDFKKNSINGSIELHFSDGVLAKVFERRCHK